MTTRLDQRLEKAGLLKPIKPAKPAKPTFSIDSSSHIYNTCSRSENVLGSPREPGYARLVVLPTYPTCPIDEPVKSDCSPEQEYVEEDYANPVDALRTNKKAVSAPPVKLAPYSSPPVSPQLPDSESRLSPDVSSQTSPKLSARPDPYQSVEDIRMMREKQRKEKGKVEVKLREKEKCTKKNVGGGAGGGVGNTAEARVSRDLDYLCEETSGYSRPFDALAAHRIRVNTASEATTSSVTLTTGPFGQGQRSNSAEKLHGNEPSARFLHQVAASDDPLPVSSSHIVLTQDSNPEGKRQRARSFSKNQVADKGPRPDGQTGIMDNSTGAVKQYILKVEDKQGEKDLTRGATGRTCSVDSSLKPQTPAKITKLRNGRDRVAIFGGKKK